MTSIWKVRVRCQEQERGTFSENGKVIINEVHVVSNSYIDAAEKAEAYFKNSYEKISIVEVGVVIERAIE